MKKRRGKSKASVALRPADCRSPREVIREALREQLHASLLRLIRDLFQQEVDAICGPRYHRNRETEAARAGSEQGSVYWDGKREPVRRPRVRDEAGEVQLEAYAALQDYDLFSKEVQELLIRGISNRDFTEVTRKLDNDLPLSKSSASRAFVRASQKDLDELNGRDLAGQEFCCLMIDGLEEDGRHYITALGVSTKGDKHILGMREGATENNEVVKDLLANLMDRNLSTTKYVLFVLDGAKALRKAVKAQWGDRAIIQRCQEHKIRNVRGYVPDHLQAEVERRMRAAYGMNSHSEAWQAMQKLLQWLEEHNAAAAKSLAEGLAETLTGHRLELPPLLRRTFRSTNPIESMFDKVRSRTGRVKNWKGRNQFARWAASALLMHEKKFKRIKGYKQLYKLLTALENLSVDRNAKVA